MKMSYDFIEDTDSTSFTNSGLESGTTYFYRVRATTDAGLVGPFSDSANAETTAVPIHSWVAVGDDTGNGNIMHSVNGIIWNDSVGGNTFSSTGLGIAYGTSGDGTSMWVAVGESLPGGTSHGNVLYSYDGISWSDSVGGTSFSNRGEGVAYGTSRDGTPMWVAVGLDTGNGNIMYSYDGISWSDSVGGDAFIGYGYAVAYGTSGDGTSMWVAVGEDGGGIGNIMYSYDGISWSDSVGGDEFSTEGLGIAYGTSGDGSPMWVATGDDGTSNGNIKYSYDGISWSDSVGGTSFSTRGNKVAYGTSGDGTPMWVAVGLDTGNGNIMYSYDGNKLE